MVQKVWVLGIAVLLSLMIPDRVYGQIIGWHDGINTVGKPSKDSKIDINKYNLGANAEVGHHYQTFSFFLPIIWTWGGEYCVWNSGILTGVHYVVISDEDASELVGYDLSSRKRPFFYRWPMGILIVLWGLFFLVCFAGGGIGIAFFSLVFGGSCLYLWFG